MKMHPVGFESIRLYFESFVSDKLVTPLIILNLPDVLKQECLQKSQKQKCIIVNQELDALKLHCLIYEANNANLVFVNGDYLIENKRLSQILKMLSETDEWKMMNYETIFGVSKFSTTPSKYYTKSNFCLFTNCWHPKSRQSYSLESMAIVLSYIE